MNDNFTADFCPACKSKTDDISAGHIISINYLGRAFVGSSNRCPQCESEEKNLFFFFLLPIIPLGTWKVKNVGRGKIITRKLTHGSITDFDTHTVLTAEQQGRWHKKLIIGFIVFVILVNVLARVLK